VRVGGVTEVADVLGVSRQRLAKLRDRADFPSPLGELAQGPVWDLDVVEAWNGSGLRQSGSGRPRYEVARRTLGGRFVLAEDCIGRGGFADVVRATDRKPDEHGETRQVAVKILREGGNIPEESIRRFARELRLLEKELHHDHIIRVLAHGDDADGQFWYAMPLATGSLEAHIRELHGAPAEIIDVMRQVCDGVGYLHSKGVFHRDLKPANILLTDEGLWALSDFGLAVEFDRKTTVLTSTLRAGLGSYCYTAPEQWTLARSADHRSDIFSLGKILQQLVTGELPITDDMPAGPLRPVVERATAKRPDDRHQSAAEFLQAIVIALGEVEEDWETPEEEAQRLLERIRLPRPGHDALAEVLSWAQRLDNNDRDDMALLTRVLPWLATGSIAALWSLDESGFRRVYQRYAAHVENNRFNFEFCDVLADFGRRVVDETHDHGLLRITTRCLIELGNRHNRWHVRSVVLAMLQEVNTVETTVAATDGILSADRGSVEWTFDDFSVRTLHPTLKSGIANYLKKAS
jgi:eukaryotic-like serine/threonine-protein kinase